MQFCWLLDRRAAGSGEGELQGVLCRVGQLLTSQGLPTSAANDRLRELDPGAPRQLGSEIERPRVLDHPEPLYSPEAREARLQGTVVLQLVVGAAVLKGLPMGLSGKAIEAVKQWTFYWLAVNLVNRFISLGASVWIGFVVQALVYLVIAALIANGLLLVIPSP